MPLPGTGRKINGLVYDYSSVTIVINKIPFQGVTEISYSDTLEPGVLRGTSAYMRGRTRGMYESESSFTMSKEDFEPLKQALASLGFGGFMETPFLISVSYAEQNSPIITDTIEGCRIKHQENSHSAGNSDGLVTKVDLSVFRIGWNGLYGVSSGVTGGIGGLISP
jgi:hypothetical protein